mmetsp:Transcript_132179/g.410786  ORF Transcript_132179/g.410786 Transcript_132179/m.410786 type:complete len:246 (-) Transcript_132179:355-1092(-)
MLPLALPAAVVDGPAPATLHGRPGSPARGAQDVLEPDVEGVERQERNDVLRPHLPRQLVGQGSLDAIHPTQEDHDPAEARGEHLAVGALLPPRPHEHHLPRVCLHPRGVCVARPDQPRKLHGQELRHRVLLASPASCLRQALRMALFVLERSHYDAVLLQKLVQKPRVARSSGTDVDAVKLHGPLHIDAEAIATLEADVGQARVRAPGARELHQLLVALHADAPSARADELRDQRREVACAAADV